MQDEKRDREPEEGAKEESDRSKLSLQVERLNTLLERLGIGFYLDLHRRPLKLFLINLVAGMGRGLGFALGATALVALILWLLKPFFSLPVVGEWIAEIADVVRENILRRAPSQ